MGIFSKVSTYNDKLEKILENKNYKSETKNLLLNMLYKIETSFSDYQKVKAVNITKEEFVEKIIDIIEKECEYINTVTPKTEESKPLEMKNVNSIVDEKLGTILVYANEKDLLYSIYKMNVKYSLYKSKYNTNKEKGEEKYLEKAIKQFFITGAAMDISEIIRDFNGWSWNTNTRDMENINYNLLYQNIIILNPKISYEAIIENNNKQLYKEINKMCLTILALQDENVKKDLLNIQARSKNQLELMQDNKKFLNEVTKIKKEANTKIKNIDEMLNNKEMLQKEYERRNEKLSNPNKIFSISHLSNILEEERNKYLSEIKKYNKIMEPMNYIQEREKQKEKYEEVTNIILATSNEKFEENLINIQKEFLKEFLKQIENAQTEQELLSLIYKLRYYCMLPISKEKAIKDILQLNKQIEETINALIDKSIDKKVMENISNSISLCYNTLKYIFRCRIIELEDINIKIVKEKEELQQDKQTRFYISIVLYDSKDAEEMHHEIVNNLKQLNIKLNKKISIILK